MHFLNFMAATTVCSGFGNPENKICYCFHFFWTYIDIYFWNGEHLSNYSKLSTIRGQLFLKVHMKKEIKTTKVKTKAPRENVTQITKGKLSLIYTELL